MKRYVYFTPAAKYLQSGFYPALLNRPFCKMMKLPVAHCAADLLKGKTCI